MIQQVTDAVRSRLVYEKKVTTARTPVGEALRLGRGVCQDFAHLFLGACRGIGLPARYVSGYIHQPGEVATHAWAQVWTGRSGWIDVDPTRGTFVGDDYIKIAIGRDYSDVPPNRGVWKGRADETIAVSVKVEPIQRVPTDWSDWSAIQAPWSAASWIQSQPRVQRVKLNPQVGYRQQQGQQQQQVIAAEPGYCETPPARGRLGAESARVRLPSAARHDRSVSSPRRFRESPGRSRPPCSKRAFFDLLAVGAESWCAEDHVEGLPLAGRPGRVHARGRPVVDVMVLRQHLGPGVDPAAVAGRRLGDAKAVGDLDLVKVLEI